MKFVDQVRVHIKAGDGGKGCVAFRREKFAPRGGPSGGDGGRGGDVRFRTDPQLTTLLDFRYEPRHFAKDGGPGLGSDCNGRAADDVVLRVPVGTVIRDEATGEPLYDLVEPNQEVVAAQGGRGGLGNMNFANSVRQAPRFAEPGRPGQERHLILELKLMADVGIVGMPNAGKSTLISRVSKARPKVADYPFTTLVPQLGVVGYKDGRSFVIADIPGLIEGAHKGAGLGHQFLRHVERCRVLIHLVDCGGMTTDEGRTPIGDYAQINRELELYSPKLAEKPQIVVGNKLDLTTGPATFAAFAEGLHRDGVEALGISAATGAGVPELLDRVAALLYRDSTDA
jgi:GTP-binding protein